MQLTSEVTTVSHRRGWILVVFAALFTAGVAYLCLNRGIPLGVPGEWVWNRQPPPPLVAFLPAAIAAAVFICVCSFLRVWFVRARRPSWLAMPAAMLLALPVHLTLFTLPNAGLGMERWFLSIENPASSGYFAVARDLENRGVAPGEFVRNYQTWIAEQDSFHIGTHPPGLFVAYHRLLRTLKDRPQWSQTILRWAPGRLAAAAEEFGSRQRRLSTPEIATVVAAALSAWTAVWLATPFVYLLARQVASPAASFTAAALWLLAPGPLLFQPVADAAYALPATAICWLLVSSPRKSIATAMVGGLAAGLVFFVGVNMSLAFLVVLMAAGLSGLFLDPSALRRSAWWTTWLALVVGVVGLLLWTRMQFELDLMSVYRINLEKHRGFYDHFHRSYWPWIGVNLIEFAVAVGAASVAFLAVCIGRRRSAGLAWGVLITLLVLDMTGKNLSEVGRLWLFLTPLAIAAAAPALEPTKAPARASIFVLVLQGIAAIFLYAAVEPLLPIQPVQ